MRELIERDASVEEVLSTRDILWRLIAVTVLVGVSLLLLLLVEPI